jgi:hypothetical protein
MPTDRPHLSHTTPGLTHLPVLSSFLLRAPLPPSPKASARVASSAVSGGRRVGGLRTASPRIAPEGVGGGHTP